MSTQYPDERTRYISAAEAVVAHHWFLGLNGSVTATGTFVDATNNQVGASFSTTIPQGNGTNSPVTLAGSGSIPKDAVGAWVVFSGPVYYQITDGQGEGPGFTADFKTNYANYAVAVGGLRGVGRVPLRAHPTFTPLPPGVPFSATSGSDIVNTTSTQVKAAAGAGLRYYITAISVSNLSASVNTRVDIQDGSGGTVLWSGPAAASGGGFEITFPTPIQGSVNTGIYAVCGTTSAQVRVSVAGYVGA